MLKRSLRWIVPLLVLVVLAVSFVVVPMVSSHAATALPTHSISDGGGTATSSSNVMWHP